MESRFGCIQLVVCFLFLVGRVDVCSRIPSVPNPYYGLVSSQQCAFPRVKYGEALSFKSGRMAEGYLISMPIILIESSNLADSWELQDFACRGVLSRNFQTCLHRAVIYCDMHLQKKPLKTLPTHSQFLLKWIANESSEVISQNERTSSCIKPSQKLHAGDTACDTAKGHQTRHVARLRRGRIGGLLIRGD